ncbi:MAG: ATP-binding protein [Candidatus Omnitrophica bacterium]|nr:ATP-binding protein [Candidatus Omnitrophota bacterium]
MKVQVDNLGPLRQAEFELGDLTIICGENNTGKTYATYALYGFLVYWHEGFLLDIPDQIVTALLHDGASELDLNPFVEQADAIIKEGCRAYTKQLPRVFASSEKNFKKSLFRIEIDKKNIQLKEEFEQNISSAKAKIFNITKHANEDKLSITLIADKEKIKIPRYVIKRAIGDAVKDILLGRIFLNPFIASAERTGAAIFRKELNFSRNRLLEQMSADKDINPYDLLNKLYSDYALPVKRNVDFTRQLEDIAKRESFITKTHEILLKEFSTIIGGEYKVTRNDELYFIPKSNKRLKLNMDESSSSVRSLLDIGFYLSHMAQKGDLLMVDEPELNLHPENQRRVARLFARLVNLGIKVFITTHSDYIVKELNTLIMLNQNAPHLNKIRENEGYKKEELIAGDQIRVYMAKEDIVLLSGNTRRTSCLTLVPADIDPELGIEASSFDKTINDMNRIQEDILFGGE